MEKMNPIDKQAVEPQPEKKPYIAPKLTNQGKIEEMTQLIPNPSPSQQPI